MSTFPPRPRFNFKIVGIVIASIIVIGGIGVGTFALLKKVKPTVPFISSSSSPTQTTAATSGDQARQQAEQFVKDHKLTEAKTAYQAAETAYTAAGNTAAALDAKQQVAVVDTAIKATVAPGQAPPSKVTGSQNHYQQ